MRLNNCGKPKVFGEVVIFFPKRAVFSDEKAVSSDKKVVMFLGKFVFFRIFAKNTWKYA
jgi:hypothetical protein